jgi:hypothetical protein
MTTVVRSVAYTFGRIQPRQPSGLGGVTHGAFATI